MLFFRGDGKGQAFASDRLQGICQLIVAVKADGVRGRADWLGICLARDGKHRNGAKEKEQ